MKSGSGAFILQQVQYCSSVFNRPPFSNSVLKSRCTLASWYNSLKTVPVLQDLYQCEYCKHFNNRWYELSGRQLPNRGTEIRVSGKVGCALVQGALSHRRSDVLWSDELVNNPACPPTDRAIR
eukprot:225297-Rhodomonas_salina.2